MSCPPEVEPEPVADPEVPDPLPDEAPLLASPVPSTLEIVRRQAEDPRKSKAAQLLAIRPLMAKPYHPRTGAGLAVGVILTLWLVHRHRTDVLSANETGGGVRSWGGVARDRLRALGVLRQRFRARAGADG